MKHKADVNLGDCFVVDSTGEERRRCLFTLATESCLRNRRSKEKLNILRALLEAGMKSDVQVKILINESFHCVLLHFPPISL